MVKIIALNGASKGETKLPAIFQASYRPDLIQRAVVAAQSARRQPYGRDPLAGKRTSADYYGVKGKRGSMKNREIARGKRSRGGNPGQELRSRFTPQSRGGRKAHPPRPEKTFALKMNRKEAGIALASAIAATASPELVKARGHRLDWARVPIIAENAVEGLKKAKDVEAFLRALKLDTELERAAQRKLRAGRGKMRGRKYRARKSVLFIISEDRGIGKAARNLPGVDVASLDSLTVECLAPGGAAGRLAVWSEDAIKKLSELK
ncbi:MAG: 50S ribosomal protein L4 [Candidatus Aenigmatarchaeota archaeon]